MDTRLIGAAMVWWKAMHPIRLAVAATVYSALLVAGTPSAIAAPASDGQGFVDSVARCTAPDTAVAFGDTETSRVAICKTPGGQYEYRGVRVRDGAKLIVPATQSGEGRFVAENDGITYTVTASSLVVSAGNQVIREEPMVDFHSPQTPPPPAATSTPTTTPAAPLPPPLPAEEGGSG
nr:hypothetical protein [Mycobacterium sp. MFM001]